MLAPAAPVVFPGESGCADQDGYARADGGVQIAGERLRRGEVDQRIACIRQRRDIAAAIHSAGEVVPAAFQDSGDRLAHAPVAADNADACHCVSPPPRASWPA
jgi:hypothetical protein